jgi:hypothetical protein
VPAFLFAAAQIEDAPPGANWRLRNSEVSLMAVMNNAG